MAALDLGLIYGLMALGVYLTFRILDFADLTVDGSFTTGGATAAVLLVGGVDPWLATAAATAAGFLAGVVTGLLNTVGRIHPLLAGILTQIGLYSINLRIMGGANVPLLRTDTLLTGLREGAGLGTGVSIAVFGAVAVIAVVLLHWFLTTDIGLGMRATGDNPGMAKAQGVNTDAMTVLGLALSNALVGMSGALIAQYQGFADIGMGVGLIVAGLASVIIGTALVRGGRIWMICAAVVLGSVLYRGIIQVALTIPWFDPNDMKLLSAIIVVLALVLPRVDLVGRWRGRDTQAQFLLDPDTTPDAEVLDSGDARPPSSGFTARVGAKDD